MWIATAYQDSSCPCRFHLTAFWEEVVQTRRMAHGSTPEHAGLRSAREIAPDPRSCEEHRRSAYSARINASKTHVISRLASSTWVFEASISVLRANQRFENPCARSEARNREGGYHATRRH